MGDVMRAKSIAKYTALLSLALVIVFAAMSLIDATPALAHCDGLDGPVVGAARMALQTADLNRVLIWVRPDDISEIRRAFDEALAIRRLGPQAQELADRYFVETLVRIHRAGEGAPIPGSSRPAAISGRRSLPPTKRLKPARLTRWQGY
jgi:hypothetical protein